MKDFYRFRLINATTFVVYLFFGIGIMTTLPMQSRWLLGPGIIIFALLRAMNYFVREKNASGIWLRPHGFVIQRGPFGMRRRFFAYSGFLRILIIPVSGRLVFAFRHRDLQTRPLSSFQRLFDLPQPFDGITWLLTPPVQQPNQMIEAFLDHAQAAQTNVLDDSIELMPAFEQYLQQFHRWWRPLRENLHLGLAFFIWLTGYNPDDQFNDRTFHYPPQSTRLALILVFVAILVAAPGSLLLDMVGAADGLVNILRVVPLLMVSGPTVWLIIQLFFQQAGIVLKNDVLTLRQPIRYFDRTIPYTEIGAYAILDNDALGLIRLKPSRIAPGDEPRPPRPQLLTSVTIQNIQACVAYLDSIVETCADWTTDDVIKRKRRRALQRRLLLFLVSPLISFILILMAIRFAFTILNLTG